MINKKTLHVIDLSWLLYKSHFAFPNLSKNGLTAGHIYGTLNYIRRILEDYNNCNIILVLDGSDAHRKLLNPEYKAGRNHDFKPNSTNFELLSLLSPIPNVYTAVNWDMEADDVIYSICKAGMEDFEDIMIHTTDKDMYQALQYDKVKIMRKYKTAIDEEVIMTKEKLKEEFGVSPENWYKYRALIGDASDNLKGYPRILKKCAAIIAEKYIDSKLDSEDLIAVKVDVEDIKCQKYLDLILSNTEVYYNNAAVMKAINCNFDLHEPDFNEDYYKTAQEKYAMKNFEGFLKFKGYVK